MTHHTTCACGCAYDDDSWAALELVGLQLFESDIYELRNCRCRSTISLEITRANAIDAWDRCGRMFPLSGRDVAGAALDALRALARWQLQVTRRAS